MINFTLLCDRLYSRLHSSLLHKHRSAHSLHSQRFTTEISRKMRWSSSRFTIWTQWIIHTFRGKRGVLRVEPFDWNDLIAAMKHQMASEPTNRATWRIQELKARLKLCKEVTATPDLMASFTRVNWKKFN